MRVLITGATGLIGKEIVKLCHTKNIKVSFLTTSKSKISDSDIYQGFYWNPKTNDIDLACFKDVDAIIHLAGATISKRWTSSYKKEIESSRIKPTQFLINSLIKSDYKIKHVISASAIGIYPDSLSNYYEEEYSEGDDTFLSQVVKQWEQAVDGFSVLNIPVTKIRIGLVLSKQGGALPEIIKPMKFGLGAAFGSGEHWQSWIHIMDLSRLFVYVLKNNLSGVFNAVSPNPVTNQEFTKSCGQVLNKPVFLPNIPKWFMSLVLGQMHTLLFLSQRVSSKKIEDAGFQFKFHHLKPALNNLLK
ncbi:TIGR01777 family oxidoreductase [Yeosuana marina]|uniref:TIGR01777 family oxidoreductase n=1 Tax=Yeosuana marina TaxID=1565536 RepID=UPI00142482E5|nr:TIGR01777 family oxidoreductase [Yeosuana marina]